MLYPNYQLVVAPNQHISAPKKRSPAFFGTFWKANRGELNKQ